MQDRSDIIEQTDSMSLAPQYGRGITSSVISLAIPFAFLMAAKASETKEKEKENKKDKKSKPKKQKGGCMLSSGTGLVSPSTLVDEAVKMAQGLRL